MNTCRFCKQTSFDGDGLVQYGTRHYAHFLCYLENGKMLTDLQDHKIVQFPYRLLQRFDLIDLAMAAWQREKERNEKFEREQAKHRETRPIMT